MSLHSTATKFGLTIAISAALFVSLRVAGQLIPFSFLGNSCSTLTAFSITGITGPSDSTVDAWLSAGVANPSVGFGASTCAASYDVVIKNSADTTMVCQVLGVTSSPGATSACTLTNATSYKAHVTARTAGGATLAATNDSFPFTVDNATITANTITGVTGGTDVTADAWLVGGVVPTINWNAFTGASTYDVVIKDSTGSSVVCALQNTAATTYNFSGCTLANNTAYKAYVTAKSPSGLITANASNTAFSFTVDNSTPGAFSITGITGGTDSTVDAYLANGTNPSVNFGTSATAVSYDVVIKDSGGTTTLCTLAGTSSSPAAVASCGLVASSSYKAYVTAKSSSGYLTTVATNNAFAFTVSAPPSPPSVFAITGATGGTDTTPDGILSSGTNVTANWQTAFGATSYDVVIRNAADLADVCATVNTTSTSYAFASCTLVAGTAYLIKVSANGSTVVPASNNGFGFQVSAPGPGSFGITGLVSGLADMTADAYLTGGALSPTVSFNTSTGATSYDATIYDSAGTGIVCATVNTTSLNANFGCTLVAGTTYKAKVVANSATGSTAAYNSLYTFYVPGTVNFCPTGSTTAKTLTIYDSGGSLGNYLNNENCNFTISPAATASAITMTFASFTSADIGDILKVYDGSSALGTLKGTFKSGSVAPGTITATTGNMFMSWVTNASTVAAGYAMTYTTAYTIPGAFSITGVTGGADVTADAALTAGTTATINWGASSAAASYDVTIRDMNNSSDVCPKVNTASTSYTFSSCTLISGSSYVVTVYAVNAAGDYTAATNNSYSFTVTAKPLPFTIAGITGGTDATTDSRLESGLLATGNWNAATNSTSYDVTIYETDGTTVKCATVNTAAVTYAFSACTLINNTYYRLSVVAKNASGSTLATNNMFSFKVGLWWLPTASAIGTRAFHKAVWTGSEMIVWGGSANFVSLTNGGRYNPTTDSWIPTSGTNFPAIGGNSSVVWTGTEMILWGGGSTNVGGRYNPTSDSWLATSTGANVPSGRQYQTAVWTGSEMIVWGGSASGTNVNSGGRYNPTTDSWLTTSVGTNVPSIREYQSAVWAGTEMIIWGGYNSPTYYNNGGRYNPTTNTWLATSIGTNVPTARYDSSIVWTGTEVIVWGGHSSAGYENSGGRYNPSSNSWLTTSVGTNVPQIRTDHKAVWTGAEMIVWGGLDSVNNKLNDGGRYNPTSNSWLTTSVGTNVPGVRNNHTAVWTGTEMIVFGGSTSGGATSEYSTGGRYNPTTNSWLATSTGGANAPAARADISSVWTGSEMIIWGAGVNTGARYNPTTDSWLATSTGANVPSIRNKHKSIWTGTEMIVWGGKDNSNVDTNTGGRYNPVSDAWLATSVGTNVPSARYSHSAIWSGSEMIVWGGTNSVPTPNNTGGRYNPATDTWLATSIGTNNPPATFEHTAVWAGTAMIVWGGNSVSTGGRYFPATDTWLATLNDASTPSGRSRHTAVWTGSEMIIWGGSGPLQTGGRYNPSTNTWVATSTGAGVPTAAEQHTAVWTGSEMIIWGGTNPGTPAYYNDGGRYNPTTNSWTATSLGTNNPQTRYGHCAVWTGSAMIIWGGQPNSGNINVGGVFTP